MDGDLVDEEGASGPHGGEVRIAIVKLGADLSKAAGSNLDDGTTHSSAGGGEEMHLNRGQVRASGHGPDLRQ